MPDARHAQPAALDLAEVLRVGTQIDDGGDGVAGFRFAFALGIDRGLGLRLRLRPRLGPFGELEDQACHGEVFDLELGAVPDVVDGEFAALAVDGGARVRRADGEDVHRYQVLEARKALHKDVLGSVSKSDVDALEVNPHSLSHWH